MRDPKEKKEKSVNFKVTEDQRKLIENEAAKQGEFMSIDEVRIRAKIGASTIDQLREFKVLDGMQESNKISFF